MNACMRGTAVLCLASSIPFTASAAEPAVRPTLATCAAGLQGSSEWKVRMVIQRPAQGPARDFEVDFAIDNGRQDNRAEDERVSHGLAQCLMRALNGRLPGERGGGASYQFDFGISNKPVGFDPKAAGLKDDAPVLAFDFSERPTGQDCAAILPTGRSWSARTDLVFQRPGKAVARLNRWSLETDKPLGVTERDRFRTFAFCMIGALSLPPAQNRLIDAGATVGVQSAP